MRRGTSDGVHDGGTDDDASPPPQDPAQHSSAIIPAEWGGNAHDGNRPNHRRVSGPRALPVYPRVGRDSVAIHSAMAPSVAITTSTTTTTTALRPNRRDMAEGKATPPQATTSQRRLSSSGQPSRTYGTPPTHPFETEGNQLVNRDIAAAATNTKIHDSDSDTVNDDENVPRRDPHVGRGGVTRKGSANGSTDSRAWTSTAGAVGSSSATSGLTSPGPQTSTSRLVLRTVGRPSEHRKGFLGRVAGVDSLPDVYRTRLHPTDTPAVAQKPPTAATPSPFTARTKPSVPGVSTCRSSSRTEPAPRAPQKLFATEQPLVRAGRAISDNAEGDELCSVKVSDDVGSTSSIVVDCDPDEQAREDGATSAVALDKAQASIIEDAPESLSTADFIGVTAHQHTMPPGQMDFAHPGSRDMFEDGDTATLTSDPALRWEAVVGGGPPLSSTTLTRNPQAATLPPPPSLVPQQLFSPLALSHSRRGSALDVGAPSEMTSFLHTAPKENNEGASTSASEKGRVTRGEPPQERYDARQDDGVSSGDTTGMTTLASPQHRSTRLESNAASFAPSSSGKPSLHTPPTPAAAAHVAHVAAVYPPTPAPLAGLPIGKGTVTPHPSASPVQSGGVSNDDHALHLKDHSPDQHQRSHPQNPDTTAPSLASGLSVPGSSPVQSVGSGSGESPMQLPPVALPQSRQPTANPLVSGHQCALVPPLKLPCRQSARGSEAIAAAGASGDACSSAATTTQVTAPSYDTRCQVGYSTEILELVQNTLASTANVARPLSAQSTRSPEYSPRGAIFSAVEPKQYGLLTYIDGKPGPNPATSKTSMRCTLKLVMLLVTVVPFACVMLLLGLYYWGTSLQQRAPLQANLAIPFDEPKVGKQPRQASALFIGAILAFAIAFIVPQTLIYYFLLATDTRLSDFESCMMLATEAASSFQRPAPLPPRFFTHAETMLRVFTSYEGFPIVGAINCFIHRHEKVPEAMLLAAIEMANEYVRAVKADLPGNIEAVLAQLRARENAAGAGNGEYDIFITVDDGNDVAEDSPHVTPGGTAAAVQIPSGQTSLRASMVRDGSLPRSWRAQHADVRASANDGIGSSPASPLRDTTAVPVSDAAADFAVRASFSAASVVGHSPFSARGPSPSFAGGGGGGGGGQAETGQSAPRTLLASMMRSSVVSLPRRDSLPASMSLRGGMSFAVGSRSTSWSRNMFAGGATAASGSGAAELGDSTIRTELSLPRSMTGRSYMPASSTSRRAMEGSVADWGLRRTGFVVCKLFLPSDLQPHDDARDRAFSSERRLELEAVSTLFLRGVSFFAKQHAGELCHVRGDSAVIAFNAFAQVHVANMQKSVAQAAIDLTDWLAEVRRSGKGDLPGDEDHGNAGDVAEVESATRKGEGPLPPFSWGIAIQVCDAYVGCLTCFKGKRVIPYISGPGVDAAERVVELARILDVPVLSMLSNLDDYRCTAIDRVAFDDVLVGQLQAYVYNVECVDELASAEVALKPDDTLAEEGIGRRALVLQEEQARKDIFQGLYKLTEGNFAEAIALLQPYAEKGYVSAVKLLRRAEQFADEVKNGIPLSAPTPYRRYAPRWLSYEEKMQEIRMQRGWLADDASTEASISHRSLGATGNDVFGEGGEDNVADTVLASSKAPKPLMSFPRHGDYGGGRISPSPDQLREGRTEEEHRATQRSARALRMEELSFTGEQLALRHQPSLDDINATADSSSARPADLLSARPSVMERTLRPVPSSSCIIVPSPDRSGEGHRDTVTPPRQRFTRASITTDSNSPDINTFTEAMTQGSSSPLPAAQLTMRSFSAENSMHSTENENHLALVALRRSVARSLPDSLNTSAVRPPEAWQNTSLLSNPADRRAGNNNLMLLPPDVPSSTTGGRTVREASMAGPSAHHSIQDYSFDAEGEASLLPTSAQPEEAGAEVGGGGGVAWKRVRRSSRQASTLEHHPRQNSDTFCDMADDLKSLAQFTVSHSNRAHTRSASHTALAAVVGTGQDTSLTVSTRTDDLAATLTTSGAMDKPSGVSLNQSTSLPLKTRRHRRSNYLRRVHTDLPSTIMDATSLRMDVAPKVVSPASVVVFLDETEAEREEVMKRVRGHSQMRRARSAGDFLSMTFLEDAVAGPEGSSGVAEDPVECFDVFGLTNGGGGVMDVLGGLHSNIFRGGNCATGQSVAIKRVPNNAKHLREAFIMANLNHANVIKLLGMDRNHDGYLFLVMTLYTSGTLGNLLTLFPTAKGPSFFQPLPQTTVKPYARQLLEALDYMHGLGIVHRDISINNILIGCDGQCVILDFGQSVRVRVKDPHGGSDPAVRRKLRNSYHSRAGSVDLRAESSGFSLDTSKAGQGHRQPGDPVSPEPQHDGLQPTSAATSLAEALHDRDDSVTLDPQETSLTIYEDGEAHSSSPNRRVPLPPPLLQESRTPPLQPQGTDGGGQRREFTSFQDVSSGDVEGALGGAEEVLDTELVSAVAGTPVFMSPQACQGIIHRKNDIWALGIVVFYCLTGTFPYEERFVNDSFTDAELVEAIGNGTAVPRLPDAVDTRVFPELDENGLDFVRLCLTTDIAARPTAEELRKKAFINT